MDYNDPEYLNLFKQVREQKEEASYTMLKETPDYSGYENLRNTNLNEIRRQNYTMDMNLSEFNIETRINGQNINEVRRQEKENRLNEVKAQLRQQMLNEVKKTHETQNLNEAVNFKDVDYVSLEMFEKARYNFAMQVVNRILPK